MYHFSNHQLYHQNTYQQQCPVFIDHTKHIGHSAIANNSQNNQFDVVQHNSPSKLARVREPHLVQHNSPSKLARVSEPHLGRQTLASSSERKAKVVANKSRVDTSNFTIEERLVAAVWVHERKTSKSSMSQIKHDFQQRFGREAPAKNTLLVWERKLFTTGSVHDAPRPGRPVNRRARVSEVLASVRSAPALSLRARALALRVPRTTLRTILRTDLAATHTNDSNNPAQNTSAGNAGKQQSSNIRLVRRRLNAQVERVHLAANTTLSRTVPPRDTYT